MNVSTTATMLTSLLSLSLISAATATDFSGSLKVVTITDAQATNTPPTATFTYTQNGDVITFDASGSSDPDGSITKYKWTLGDGSTSEGATATYTFTGTTNFDVTLTVVDNSNGVALNQQIITPTQRGFADDFSTNTSGDYAQIFGSGALSVTDGYAHMSTTYSGRNIFYNTNTLGSPDQYIEYSADLIDAGNQAGVAFRVNPTNKTGYVAYFDASKLCIRGFNMANGSWTGLSLGSNAIYPAGKHSVTISIKGNQIYATVDGKEAINATQAIYTTGDYAGIVMYRSTLDPKIYDFKARLLQ